MSEKIKITIVTDNEKLNNSVDDFKKKFINVTHDSSMTIMSTLLKNNLISGSFCGGRGDCGRCRIQFLEGATIPTQLERNVVGAEELRLGYRLACLARPGNDCVIKLAFSDEPETAVVTEVMDVTKKNDYIGQQSWYTRNRTSDVTKLTDDREPTYISGQSVILKRPADPESADIKNTDVMIAVDLGTTTIAMQLMEPNTGCVLDTYCEMNPQRRYGADVLSRIQASCDGNREVLQRLVIEALERGVTRFKGRSANIKCMCIAGNTTMEHLLMGYDVSSLGRSPFTPVEIGLQEYGHPAWDFSVWLVPGISAFVGGDIVAGLYACGMLMGKSREEADVVLFIDLGTNGEMAIADGERMIVTATAAGPAFDGGAGACIIGSDMVACTAALLNQGVLDETGLLKEPFFTGGVSVRIDDRGQYRFVPGKSDRRFYLTQEDIRSLQMAKAAVRAGVEILLKRLKEEQSAKPRPDKMRSSVQQDVQVYLAGGFGYYLDVEAAFRVGLLPEHLRGHVLAVGNTALSGAYRVGRDLWRHKIDKQTLEQSLSSIDSINLAGQAEFEKLYIQYMNFAPSHSV